MKFRFKLLTIIICSLLCLTCFSISAKTNEIDIATSSVRDDLASMDMDKLSYLSDTENIFITMSQYYDNDNKLRSYLYINYIGNFETDTLYVNLSTSIMDENYIINDFFSSYKLFFINNEETWCKYEILGLSNLENTTRRYKIDSVDIYHYTSQSTSKNTIISNINQTFIYNGITNDSIEVFHEEIETITITNKEIGFYCYGDYADWYFQETSFLQEGDIYTDSWYIFFNTDKPIDTLLEIELTYTQYDYHFYRSNACYSKQAFTEDYINQMKNGEVGAAYPDDFEKGKSYVNYHDPVIKTILPGTTKISYINKGWFGIYDTYYEELDNIMNLKEYQAKDSDNFVFTNYANNYDWAVHFTDTTRQFDDYVDGFPIALNADGSGMSDIAILRLTFETNGIIKNCYAVDIPTDDFTGNNADIDTKIEELLEKVMMLLGLVVLVVFICLFPPLLNVFTYLFKVIVYILSLPVKFIKWLLRDEKKP